MFNSTKMTTKYSSVWAWKCMCFLKQFLLLLQLALQPLWVLACSTIIEYSQQEGFYRVQLPAACQPPNMEDQWLERSNSCHQVSPTPETTQANPSSRRWNYGREIAENFAESGDFHVTFKTTAARKSRDHLISEALWQFPITRTMHIIS